MRIKILSLLSASAFALTACVGNAPAPETEPTNVSANDSSEQEQPSTPSSDSSLQNPQELGSQSGPIFNSQALDGYRLATPENIPTAPEQGPATSEGKTTAAIADPYTAIPAIVQSIFDYANTLHKAGYTDSASAYLERFRVIKPLWEQWESKADSMLNEFGKVRAEKAKAYEPMVFQIQNMNRASSDYGLVAETADSLIALAPGDSLTQWAKAQKSVAYKNTLVKAKKEYAAIKDLADRTGASKRCRCHQVLGISRSGTGSRQGRHSLAKGKVQRSQGASDEAEGKQAPQRSQRTLHETRRRLLHQAAQDDKPDVCQGTKAKRCRQEEKVVERRNRSARQMLDGIP